MPGLKDIVYSREVCISAVRDYYDFLSKMYVPESDIREPPSEGWPTITTDAMRDLNKTEEVISLLRHLPYIRMSYEGTDIEGAAWCKFVDWASHGGLIVNAEADARDLKVTSEIDDCDAVPAHVVGLTLGGGDSPIFLLDTKLGIVHWAECPGEVRYNPTREPIVDDPYEYAIEAEAEWRADGCAWAVADFFELLKDRFRDLQYIPTSTNTVIDIYTNLGPDTEGLAAMLQDIYRGHGWPSLEQYRKQDCLNAVRKALEERYPGFEIG